MESRWQRVKQRKVVQWALAYLAVAALLVGVASDLAQGFAWAVVVLRVLVAVLAVGLLVVVVIAWYHGDKGQQRVTAPEALLLTGLLVLGATAGWIAASTSPAARDGGEAPTMRSARIVVLPCDYPSGKAEFDFLSLGLAEQVIAHLTKVAGVRPVALNSVLQYRNRRKDYQRIGGELDAGVLLDCSIRADAAVMRVTFHLIDVRTQTELWAEPFERAVGDLLGADAEIAMQVVHSLDADLSSSDQKRIAAMPARSQDAWFEYLRGLQLTTPMQADLQKAVEHFSNSIRLDPAFAPAHAGLAGALASMGEFGIVAPREARDTAKAAAARALALDGNLGEAYAARGLVEFWFDWDWAAAEADLQRALALNPSSAKAHFNYAVFLTALQRHDDAVAHMIEGVNLDPLNAFAHSYVAWAHFHAGDRQRAVELIRSTMRRFPESADALALLLAWFEASLGNYTEALGAARRAETVIREDPWLRTVLAVVYTRAGERRHADRLLADLRALQARRFVDPRYFAFVHAALGDTARALTELEAAYQLGSPQLVFLRDRDFLQDPLQASPRYQALVQRMRFPERRGIKATAR